MSFVGKCLQQTVYFIFWMLTSASWALKLCRQDVIPFCLKYTGDVTEMGGRGGGGGGATTFAMLWTVVHF